MTYTNYERIYDIGFQHSRSKKNTVVQTTIYQKRND